MTFLLSNNKALTQMQGIALLVIVAIAAIGGGYYYYEMTKPKPPIELAIYAGVGDRALLEKVVAPIFLEKYNCKLLVLEALSAENLAKAIAEKNNPVASVVSMDEGPFLQAKALGLCSKVTEKEIPNLAKVPQKFRDPNQLGVSSGLWVFGMFYDSKTFEAKGWSPPTSWYDLWDPKFKGRVVLPTASSTWSYTFAMIINKLEGGTDTNWDPGFKKMKTLVPNLHSFSPRSSNTMTLLERGEVWIGPFGLSYTLVASRDKGLPMKGVNPKEGSAAYGSWMYVPNNAKNLDLAYKYLDFILSDEFAAEYFKSVYTASANPEGVKKLTGEYKQLYEALYGSEVIAKSLAVNWDVYATMKDKFIERWNKEIETTA